MNKPYLTGTAGPECKRLAIERTIIPLSWNPNEPLAHAKWNQHILVENYAHLGDRVVEAVQEQLFVESC